MTQMADYLDSHPDVQQAFQDARSRGTPQERHAAMKAYTGTRSEVAAAFQSIHQPVEDLNVNCGLPQGMVAGGMMAGSMSPGQGAAACRLEPPRNGFCDGSLLSQPDRSSSPGTSATSRLACTPTAASTAKVHTFSGTSAMSRAFLRLPG